MLYLPNELVITDPILLPAQYQQLQAWVSSLLASKQMLQNPLSNKRHYKSLKQLSSSTELDLAYELRERLAKLLEMSDYEEDPNLGNILTCHDTGAHTHPHIDLYKKRAVRKKFLHARLNVMLSKPEEGGDIIICDKPFNISEFYSWGFFPSELEHASTPVIGTKKRMLLSFGFKVPKERIDELLEQRTKEESLQSCSLPECCKIAVIKEKE